MIPTLISFIYHDTQTEFYATYFTFFFIHWILFGTSLSLQILIILKLVDVLERRKKTKIRLIRSNGNGCFQISRYSRWLFAM